MTYNPLVDQFPRGLHILSSFSVSFIISYIVWKSDPRKTTNCIEHHIPDVIWGRKQAHAYIWAMFCNLDTDEPRQDVVWLMGQWPPVQTRQQINKLCGLNKGGKRWKPGGVKREGSRGCEAGRVEMMSHYKGREKSKWKWGATKEHSGFQIDI